MRRRDGTPQTLNVDGFFKSAICDDCGLELRASNLARHRRARHEPGYVPPSRQRSYYVPARVRRDQEPGFVYVLHLSRPVGDHARHYCGWAKDVESRLADHRHGRGARLTAHAVSLGIGLTLGFVMVGTRADERRVKRNRRLAQLCEYCRPEALELHAERARAYRREKRAVA